MANKPPELTAYCNTNGHIMNILRYIGLRITVKKVTIGVLNNASDMIRSGEAADIYDALKKLSQTPDMPNCNGIEDALIRAVYLPVVHELHFDREIQSEKNFASSAESVGRWR